jgi:excisionase family DNA binding protein
MSEAITALARRLVRAHRLGSKAGPGALRVKDVAERWECSPGKIRRMILSGELHALRIGKLLRVPIEAVIVFEAKPRARRTKNPLCGTGSGIVALCAAFDALQVGKQAIFDNMPDGAEREDAVDEIERQQEPLIYRLAAAVAMSVEEQRARARTVVLYLGGAPQLREDAKSSLWDKRLTAAVLRDLAEISDA